MEWLWDLWLCYHSTRHNGVGDWVQSTVTIISTTGDKPFEPLNAMEWFVPIWEVIVFLHIDLRSRMFSSFHCKFLPWIASVLNVFVNIFDSWTHRLIYLWCSAQFSKWQFILDWRRDTHKRYRRCKVHRGPSWYSLSFPKAIFSG